MTFSLKNYNLIQEKIRENGKKTQIIAISKNHSKEAILEAISSGIKLFGENRVKEAKEKYSDIKTKHPEIKLHFTGNLQTNKIKEALEFFDTFHTIYKEKQLIELSKHFEKAKKKEYFVQVNTGHEETKGGVLPNDAKEFVKIAINKFKMNIIGLMCIPPINEKASNHFDLLKKLKDELGLKALSMGMSDDFEEAINCDSDYIRVGTFIFGERN